MLRIGIQTTTEAGRGGSRTKEATTDGEKRSARGTEGDDEKETRTVFVGNLPTSFNPKKVKSVFKEYGAVESVRLRSVAVAGTAVDKAGDQARKKKKLYIFIYIYCFESLFIYIYIDVFFFFIYIFRIYCLCN